MKPHFIFFLILMIFPFVASAQTVESRKNDTAISGSQSNTPIYQDPTIVPAAAVAASNISSPNYTRTISHVYLVAEAGSISNKSVTSGSWANFDTQNNSGGIYGVALGYRAISPENWIYGVELSIAASSASSSVTDCCSVRTFDEKQVSGLYLTAGRALDRERKLLLYFLLGIGAGKADSITTDLSGAILGKQSETGNGISYGGAIEYRFTDNIGIRVKALHNRYKGGDIEELRIRDTYVTGGLVFSF